MKLAVVFILSAILLFSLFSFAEGATRRENKKLLGTNPDFLESSKVHTIPLKRKELSKDSKIKVFNFISEAQTLLKSSPKGGAIFLERSHSSTQDTHQVRLTNYQNTQFIGKISFAHPSEEYNAIFDTGNIEGDFR